MALASLERTRTDLHTRLQQRRGEIEEAAVTRVYAVSAPPPEVDLDYAHGLRAAVAAAIDYGLTAVEVGVERLPPVPAPLLVQARLAARYGIGLDTVLRRYVAGSTVLRDFIMQEAAAADLLKADAIHRIGRDQAVLLDRLLTAVSEEHARELENRVATSEERRAELINQLLAGELVDASVLEYDFGAHHIGAVATGPSAAAVLRELVGSLDCRALLVAQAEETAWAWFGARRGFARELELPSDGIPGGVSVALGEPAHELAGWRLTHRQAVAALPVAIRSDRRLVRYSEAAVLASILQDDVFAASLQELYLSPLTSERDGGEMLRGTLRAYFSANRNVSSAAASLGVSRRTVANRLRTVEERIGRPLDSALIEMDAALRLDAFDRTVP